MHEGADSVGLSHWQKCGFIILPQALTHVIPGIVNTFIGLFYYQHLSASLACLIFLALLSRRLRMRVGAAGSGPHRLSVHCNVFGFALACHAIQSLWKTSSAADASGRGEAYGRTKRS